MRAELDTVKSYVSGESDERDPNVTSAILGRTALTPLYDGLVLPSDPCLAAGPPVRTVDRNIAIGTATAQARPDTIN